MAVIPGSLCFAWAGSTGAFDFGGTENYLAVWKLQVSDPLDQAQTVLDWFVTNVVTIGQAYTYGNDVRSTFAFAQNIAADNVSGTNDWWYVRVTYQPVQPGQEDDQGEPSEDPLTWRPRISVRNRITNELFEHGWYRGGLRDTFWPHSIDDYIPFQASNQQPFTNPPVEGDEAQVTVILGTNVSTVNERDITSWINSVNSVPFQAVHRGITVEVEQYVGRIRDIQLNPQRYKNIDYVEVDFIIDKKYTSSADGLGTEIGHRIELLDKATLAKACPDDPDMRGGYYEGQGSGTTPLPEAGARSTSMVDPFEKPLTGEVFLDGRGRAQDPCTAPVFYYGMWSKYAENDFLQIPILQDLIAAWTPPP